MCEGMLFSDIALKALPFFPLSDICIICFM